MEEYKHFSEALEDLKSLKETGIYADLSSDETSMADAMKLCKAILKIAARCPDSIFFTADLTEETAKEFSDILKSMGCVKWKDASPKFKSTSPQTMDQLMLKKGSIEYPISFISQLIDTSKDTFEYGLCKGGNVWSTDWLNTQTEKTLKD